MQKKHFQSASYSCLYILSQFQVSGMSTFGKPMQKNSVLLSLNQRQIIETEVSVFEAKKSLGMVQNFG